MAVVREAGSDGRAIHTVGTINHAPGRWIVRARPHVRLRLKRVFERIAKQSHDQIEISDTPENCRELQWFLLRYPMDCDNLPRLQGQAQRHRDLEASIESIVSGNYVPPKIDLALPPRQYQSVAARLVVETGGTLIADELGTGKTVVAIAAMVAAGKFPALVVTMTHLTRQWKAEIERFAPHLRCHILKKGTPYNLVDAARKELFQDLPIVELLNGDPSFDVLISNYHKLSGWADVLAEQIRFVAFDECQELRRGQSAKYSAARHISAHAEIRCGTSATPIYNYGDEMFSVLENIRPGALGTHGEFLREWCSQFGQSHIIKQPEAFGAYLREQGLMLRRTRTDVGREIPSLTKAPVDLDCDPGALRMVQSSALELAKLVLTDAPLEKGKKLQAAEELSWLLRQATGVAKAPYVATFVKMMVEQGEKVLLLGYHHAVYDVWVTLLSEHQPAMFTGKQTDVAKAQSADRFLHDEKCRVMIMSLRSGAGLDGLQHVCRTVVHGELDWSPGIHDQSTGRVHRDGQTHPVIAYYMVTDQGSDPVVADVLGLKRQQIEGIRDPDGPAALVQRVDVDAIKSLAKSYLEQVEKS